MPEPLADPSANLPIVGKWATIGGNRKDSMTLIETDDRSRVVLPGHPNQRFVVRENEDGSILLEPARVITEARALLSRAAASKTVARAVRRR